jgi:hypothetical protein
MENKGFFLGPWKLLMADARQTNYLFCEQRSPLNPVIIKRPGTHVFKTQAIPR